MCLVIEKGMLLSFILRCILNLGCGERGDVSCFIVLFYLYLIKLVYEEKWEKKYIFLDLFIIGKMCMLVV